MKGLAEGLIKLEELQGELSHALQELEKWADEVNKLKVAVETARVKAVAIVYPDGIKPDLEVDRTRFVKVFKANGDYVNHFKFSWGYDDVSIEPFELLVVEEGHGS